MKKEFDKAPTVNELIELLIKVRDEEGRGEFEVMSSVANRDDGSEYRCGGTSYISSDQYCYVEIQGDSKYQV